ncbi:hypothetical protein C8E83_1059 [Frondihabitans australicus]|uniref:Uncharacterized protein n=1 Tax=Frondihabitans australicus TaxID=386892 RepID=A0A495IDU9_9MICO|nr:hypothetical protein C8E83_1059 [Frondihabitans australicus]
MTIDDDAAVSSAAADPKRPIRPAGAPPRPGAAGGRVDAPSPVPSESAAHLDDATVVRPQPIPLPRRVLRDEPLVAERIAPPGRESGREGVGGRVPDPATTRPATAPVRTLAPAAAALPTAPAVASVLTHRTIGRSAGHLDLGDPRWSVGSATTLLETRVDVLPELDDDVPVRRLTRQPAFLVSMGAAVVVVVVVVVIVLMQTVFRGPDRVENLQLLDGGANYVLQWNGPNVPYAIAMTNASTGKTIDVSSLVRGGREAWIPKNGAEVTDRSCFIVRSQREATSQKLPATAAGLSAQGAAKVCVSQISSN